MMQFFNGVFHAAHRTEGIEMTHKSSAFVNVKKRVSICPCGECDIANRKIQIAVPTHRLLTFATEQHLWAGYYTFDRNEAHSENGLGQWLFIGAFTDNNPVIAIFQIVETELLERR